MLVTDVYGPTTDSLRFDFFREVRFVGGLAAAHWVLLGDFNVLRWIHERSTLASDFATMDAFNELISNLQLFDVPIDNRLFTWTNRQPSPIASRLDRCLLSPQWLATFPKISFSALPCVVSDHCPLLLRCSNLSTHHRISRVERFWLPYQQFQLIAQNVWADRNVLLDPIRDFKARTAIFHKELQSWSRENFNKPDVALLNAKGLIQFLDRLEELRTLTSLEFVLRIKLREKAYELANILEIKWHQRARLKWLRCGDETPHIFKPLLPGKEGLSILVLFSSMGM